ncbi:871_t:CDS:2, partial [Gigaspora rosea]
GAFGTAISSVASYSILCINVAFDLLSFKSSYFASSLYKALVIAKSVDNDGSNKGADAEEDNESEIEEVARDYAHFLKMLPPKL